MSSADHTAKRAAFESPADLARPVQHDPAMKRPISTVAGAVLVLLSALSGVFVIVEASLSWTKLATDVDVSLDAMALTPETKQASLVVFIILSGTVCLLQALFGVLVLVGRNLPRVIVMALSVFSIVTAFVGWWAQGQDITLHTTLPALALDILVLLALSSRSAASYARRNERT